jgi:hypothetical protein
MPVDEVFGMDSLPEPLRVHLDFGAEAVDELLDRLTVLRAQMLPPLSAARN